MRNARSTAELANLASVLLYGDHTSRQQAALTLLAPEQSETLAVLAATARADLSWLLRVRALEALTIAAEVAGAAGASRILDLLFGRLAATVERAPGDRVR